MLYDMIETAEIYRELFKQKVYAFSVFLFV